MAKRTLYNHVWDRHTVETLPNGDTQLFIGLHMVHEVTSPQAFSQLSEHGETVAYPDRTVATVDHIVPTDSIQRPFQDPQAEAMLSALQHNTNAFGVQFFGLDSGQYGIVHIVGPELGFTQPGMTIVCGDSHTSTHGAFGSLAFGIGTTQIEHVLATQTLALPQLKVRQIQVTGTLAPGVSAKDVILKIIQTLGVHGGIGYAYEYAGSVIESMDMEGRMTICNMSIEGGARVGYVNPDETTFAYMKGRPYAPNDAQWAAALDYWTAIRTQPEAEFDDQVFIDGNQLEPMVTWGIHPGQSVGISERLPMPNGDADMLRAYDHMGLTPGDPIAGTPIDVAFIGSCTNARLPDLREAAAVLTNQRVHDSVRCLVVPGSSAIKQQAEAEGLDKIFKAAGADWRSPGCSMCLAMNPDQLVGNERCASSSNRNFIGRQGSATGRTFLMSPAMVATAAIHGCITDCRA